MLVTFKTSAYASIIMFGDVALDLLGLMGFGTSVPGAIDSEDVPEALARLESALENLPPEPELVEDDEPVPISLKTRALPLLELLQAAIKDETFVRWE